MTFLMYGVVSVIACVFCYKFVPETNLVSLEEIESKLMQSDFSNVEKSFSDGPGI